MTEHDPAFPKPPAQVAPYVEVLGRALTIEFILSFGGAELNLPADPKGRSRLEALVGYERAKALADMSYRLQRRVPLAKRWIAACLYCEGASVAEIARTLRTTDVTIRKGLKARDIGERRRG